MFARGPKVAAIAIAVVLSALFGALVNAAEPVSISFPEVLRDTGIGAVPSISHPEILRDRTLRAVTSISYPDVLRETGIGAVSSISHPEILRDRTLRAVTSISYPDVLREPPAQSVTSIGFPEILRDAGLTPAASTQVAEARETSFATAVVSAFTLAGMIVGWILGRWTNGAGRRPFAPVGR